MIARYKRFVWPVAFAALLVALVIASWPTNSGSQSNEDRAAEVSSQIRCPTCAGLSIAESESPLAISARTEAAAQVAAGRTNQEILDFFVSRYGNTALMSPPKEGLTAYAYAAPIIGGLAAIGGIAYALRRWKRRDNETATPEDEATAAMFLGGTRVAADGTDLAYWVKAVRKTEADYATGSTNDDEYESLRSSQVHRLAELARAADQPAAKKKATTFKFKAPKKQQGVAWMGAASLFVIVGIVALALSTGDRSGNGNITGATAGNSNSLLARAAEQTSEAKPADAIETYDQVLALDPTNATALSYKGWLIRLAGLPDQGEAQIDAAIAADPTYPDARFFKGYILLRDRNDPAGAIEQLDVFLANDEGSELTSLVEQTRSEAEAQLQQ